MDIVWMLAAFAAYMAVGLLTALMADNRPRWCGAFDRMGTGLQWLVWLTWPIALPIALRQQERRRGWR